MESAVRLAGLLRGLAGLHPALGAWYKQSMRRPEYIPICAEPVEAEGLEPFIRKGASYEDAPRGQRRAKWPERGFSVGAWNGALSGAAANFSLQIGAIDEGISAFNRMEVSLTDDERFGSLISREVVLSVLDGLLRAMEPNCADVFSRRWTAQALSQGAELTCPNGGWMSYVAADRRDLLPAELKTRVFGQGYLAEAVEDDFFSDLEPTHFGAAMALNGALVAVRGVEGSFKPDTGKRAGTG